MFFPSGATTIPMSFDTLGLSDKVLSAVTAVGYTTPTPIQEQGIPHVLARRDVLGLAQTGTGKTASFTLPMLTLLEQGRARARMPRTLILEPTRELAAQRQHRQREGSRLARAGLRQAEDVAGAPRTWGMPCSGLGGGGVDRRDGLIRPYRLTRACRSSWGLLEPGRKKHRPRAALSRAKIGTGYPLSSPTLIKGRELKKNS